MVLIHKAAQRRRWYDSPVERTVIMGYEIRKRYDCYVETAGFLHTLDSETVQDFKDDCDVNRILSIHEQTGEWPRLGKKQPSDPMFGDFQDVPDFQTSQNLVVKARELFDQLPVNVRDRFNYDPVKLVNFLNDKDNKVEAQKLGLVKLDEVPIDVSNVTVNAGDPVEAAAVTPVAASVAAPVPSPVTPAT